MGRMLYFMVQKTVFCIWFMGGEVKAFNYNLLNFFNAVAQFLFGFGITSNRALNSVGDGGLDEVLSDKKIPPTWAVASYLGLGHPNPYQSPRPWIKPQICGHLAT